MSKIICPKCGAVNDEDAKFCINCGEVLIFEPPINNDKSSRIEDQEPIEEHFECFKCGKTAYYTCNKCGK